MPVKVNLAAFKAVSFASDALTTLCSIIHPCPKEGMYVGRVLDGGRAVGAFTLMVDPRSQNAQTDIDLAGFSQTGGEWMRMRKMPAYSVKTDGFVQFYVSSGEGRYVVELRNAGTSEGSRASYTTKTLRPGDIFSAILISPGSYGVKDLKSGKKALLVVKKPEHQKQYLSAGPMLFNLGADGFTPASGEVMAGRGAAVLVEEGTAVVHITQAKDDLGRAVKNLKTDWRRMPGWVKVMGPGGSGNRR